MNCFTKFWIWGIASKDAKGIYGEIVANRQNNLDNPPTFVPSSWMRSLVCDFTNAAEKLSNKRKDIVKLYAQIRQYYAKFSEANKEFKNQESESRTAALNIEKEISRIDEEIKRISSQLSEFHGGKPLQNGVTVHMLMTSRAEFEQIRAQKRGQKESICDLSSARTEYDKIAKELGDKVIQLESDFSVQIDLLYRKICGKEIKYNEWISWYWQNLCKCIQNRDFDDGKQQGAKPDAGHKQGILISESAKQLKDIAECCGTFLQSKDDLFKDERKYINETINPAMGIDYAV